MLILNQKEESKEESHMKGYEVAVGYMGYVDGEYMLFASETEYYEFMREVA